MVTALTGAIFGLTACAPAAPPTTSTAAQPVTLASQPTNGLPAFTSAPVPTVVATLPPATTTPISAPTSAPTAASQVAVPPPNCSNGITPSQTEGPYYKANTPERASLLPPGVGGSKIILTGYVLTRDCKPIAGAWLDFWQANDKGEYDNSGYMLRGHQFTDANGRYMLETIVPGLYPGRTRHIHVKVQAPNQPILTTQLYFPEEQHNNTDSIYNPKLLVTWQATPEGKIAFYSFVLNVN